MHPEEIELREARAQNVQKERPQLPEQHRATILQRLRRFFSDDSTAPHRAAGLSMNMILEYK